MFVDMTSTWRLQSYINGRLIRNSAVSIHLYHQQTGYPAGFLKLWSFTTISLCVVACSGHAIAWANADVFSLGRFSMNFETKPLSVEETHWKMSSGTRQPFWFRPQCVNVPLTADQKSPQWLYLLHCPMTWNFSSYKVWTPPDSKWSHYAVKPTIYPRYCHDLPVHWHMSLRCGQIVVVSNRSYRSEKVGLRDKTCVDAAESFCLLKATWRDIPRGPQDHAKGATISYLINPSYNMQRSVRHTSARRARETSTLCRRLESECWKMPFIW